VFRDAGEREGSLRGQRGTGNSHNSPVVCDQIISFPRLAREGEEPVLFRRVEILDKEKQETVVFLSNLLAFGATTIAAIYRIPGGWNCSQANAEDQDHRGDQRQHGSDPVGRH
jgi:hypothetical protein